MLEMKLNEIRTFVAVAQTGSVQAAADRLHMTQSAVSRLVQRLEMDLGATLFDRHAKPLILGAAEAFTEALAPDTAPSGVLRIGSAHALAELIAERPLDALRSTFPDLTLQLSVDWTKPLLQRLEDGELDAVALALLNDGAPATECSANCLGKEDVRIIGSTALASTRWRSLRAMNEMGWVIQPEQCGYRIALARALEEAGAGPPRVVVEAFGKNLQLSVIARGAGFGLLPASQLKAIPHGRKIRAFDVPDFRATVSTWFVRRRHPGRLSRSLDTIEQMLASSIA
jgi:DNA-binding transcriptional LysR family regulator